MCKSYFSHIDTFLSFYRYLIPEENRYNRTCDVTKALHNISTIYPDIYLKRENKSIVIYGICPERSLYICNEVKDFYRLHKIETYDTNQEDQERIIQEMSKADIIKRMDPIQREFYDSLDIILKIEAMMDGFPKETYQKSDQYNYLLMKSLIEKDIEEKKNLLKRKLLQGESPHCMSHVNQYIIYHMTDSELEACVRGKNIRKGARDLKRTIRKQIGYLFRRKKTS